MSMDFIVHIDVNQVKQHQNHPQRDLSLAHLLYLLAAIKRREHNDHIRSLSTVVFLLPNLVLGVFYHLFCVFRFRMPAEHVMH